MPMLLQGAEASGTVRRVKSSEPVSRRVLVAFDKFKGSLSAQAACEIAQRVIRRDRPGWHVDAAPLADGGDGFCRILTAAAGGQIHECRAQGPLVEGAGGTTVVAPIGVLDIARLPPRARELLDLDARAKKLALVEMASISGLALVPRERIDVWRSSSYGTGEMLAAAAALGVDAILLGVGGSATSDLGLGALDALGLSLFSAEGEPLHPPVPELWPRAAKITGKLRQSLPPLRIACDVDNPVFGPKGAAAIYGPQKGLRPEDLERFEEQAKRVAALLVEHLGVPAHLALEPGAGAAGGIAFGLVAAAGARLVPGSSLVTAWLELDARLRAADWIVTGEGRYDDSSGSGKGPGALVAAARAAGRRCAVFAGSIALMPAGEGGAARDCCEECELIAISDPALPLEQTLAGAAQNLERSLAQWLRTLPE